MKKLLAVCLLGLSVGAVVAACTPRQAARTAIDVALAACISAHAEVEDEAELRAICQWTEELAPIVKDLLRARRQGVANVQRLGCTPDGGK